MPHDSAVQSVERALKILGAFDSDRTHVGIVQMAASLGVHPSTASRLAATLAAHGFLERASASEAFRLGPEIVRLGLMAAGGQSLIETARTPMDELAAETAETVVLSVPSGSETVDVSQVDTRYLVGGKSWVGRRLPLHATSNGKVFVAFGAAALPDGPLESVTARTITDRRTLQRKLSEVREQGWAPAVGECEEGLNGAAAPIFGSDGRCIAAVSVSGPAYRLDAGSLPELGRRCRAAANAISTRLGSYGAAAERMRVERAPG